jgi:hypothetical protein
MEHIAQISKLWENITLDDVHYSTSLELTNNDMYFLSLGLNDTILGTYFLNHAYHGLDTTGHSEMLFLHGWCYNTEFKRQLN